MIVMMFVYAEGIYIYGLAMPSLITHTVTLLGK